MPSVFSDRCIRGSLGLGCAMEKRPNILTPNRFHSPAHALLVNTLTYLKLNPHNRVCVFLILGGRATLRQRDKNPDAKA
jgi:hypothetical protein